MGETSHLRWAAGYLRPYRRGCVALAMLSTLEIALRVMAPFALMVIVDHAIGTVPVTGWLAHVGLPADHRHLLVVLVLLGVGVQLGHELVVMLHGRVSVMIGQGMIHDLREQLFGHVQAWHLAVHGAAKTGDVVQRLERDTRCIEQMVFRGISPVVFSALTLVVMFGVLATIDLPLALLSLAIVPPLYVWLRCTRSSWAPHADHARNSDSRLTSRLVEALTAIRLIKSHAREDHEQAQFSAASSDAARAWVTVGHQGTVFAIVTGALTICGTSAVLLAGGLGVLDGRITLGTLLLVLAYLGYVYGPLTAIANTSNELRQAFASARRVRAAFAIEPEHVGAPDALCADAIRGEVRFERVTFRYGAGPEVLGGIDLAARPGETIALVGRSGAGKTTLASLLVRFYDASSGTISIDAVPIERYDLRGLRRRIALVLQEAIVISGSVRENLRYGRADATDAELEIAARAANAHEFIVQLPAGYDTILGDGVAGLSSGQRQRLSIARAFLRDAPILILDEPTASLDTISERQIVEALHRLCAGRTTFVIAHRLSTVREATRIVVLDHGLVAGEGTHEELLATNELYGLLATQLA